MAFPPVAPRSDGEGDLGECSREPMPGSDASGEFVVGETRVLNEGVPRTDHMCGPQPLRATHGR
jgi:hypothetical protein